MATRSQSITQSPAADTVAPASDTTNAGTDTTSAGTDTTNAGTDTVAPAPAENDATIPPKPEDTTSAGADTVASAVNEVAPVVEEEPREHNPNFAEYSTGQREQDQALRIAQEKEALAQSNAPGFGALRAAQAIPMMRVRKARQGSNLPIGGGGFYPDGDFEIEVTNMFAQRRIRDGSLIKLADNRMSTEPQRSPQV